jgi:7-cyano-7-deazaguanine synthase
MPIQPLTGELTPASRIGVLLSGGIDSAVLVGRTGCVWQDCELRAVRQFLSAVARPALRELVVLEMPVGDLYAGHWSVSGRAVPDHSTPDEAVFLPGRNPLLLLKPALWCRMNDIPQLAIATLANNPFDDARPEFFARFEEMLRAATGGPLEILRPFERLAKPAVIELGRELPLELTFSCLAPVDDQHCGRCNKCAERRAAFRQLAMNDPTRYAS